MELVIAYNARNRIRNGTSIERALALTEKEISRKRFIRELDSIHCHVELGKRVQWILGWYSWREKQDRVMDLDTLIQFATKCELMGWHEVNEHNAVLVINGIKSYERLMNPEMADSIIYKDWCRYLLEEQEIETNLAFLKQLENWL